MNDTHTSEPVWFYSDGDTVRGPISQGALLEKAANGQVTHDTPIVEQGKRTWTTFGALNLPVPPPVPQASTTLEPAKPETGAKSRSNDKAIVFTVSMAVSGALAYFNTRETHGGDAASAAESKATEVRGGAAAPSRREFTLNDAEYLYDAASKLLTETNEAFGQMRGAEETEVINLLRNGKLKTELLLRKLALEYGYDPRLRAVGTVRSSVADALFSLLTMWELMEEWRAAKTNEAQRVANDSWYVHFDLCRDALANAAEAWDWAEHGDRNKL